MGIDAVLEICQERWKSLLQDAMVEKHFTDIQAIWDKKDDLPMRLLLDNNRLKYTCFAGNEGHFARKPEADRRINTYRCDPPHKSGKSALGDRLCV